MPELYPGFRVLPGFDPTYPLVPYMALSSHLPPWGAELELSSSSTWGRADQQTSRDSYESGAFCFARENSYFSNIGLRGLFVPSIAPPSHLPNSGSRLELFLSSTWGRADQQTLHDSNRVWGVLFCPKPFLPYLLEGLASELFLLPPKCFDGVDLSAPLVAVPAPQGAEPCPSGLHAANSWQESPPPQ